MTRRHVVSRYNSGQHAYASGLSSDHPHARLAQRRAIGGFALTLALGALASHAALAQTSLPPIVVEGASRAVRPVPVAEPGPAPAPTPRPQAKRAPTKRAPATAAASPAIAADIAPAGSPTTASAVEAGSVGGVEAGSLAQNQGTAVSVVTGEDLRSRQVRTPVDALRSQPGVAVGRTGGFAGLGQVRIRGAEGNHTLVLIDGIEANNPGDGEFDFSNLVGGEEIERIEILRGPQSGLYGSGAVGGVINIVTRSGKGPLTLTTRAEAGSFNTREAAAVVSGGNDKAWGLAGVQSRYTGGYNISRAGKENDASRTTSSIAKFGFRPLEPLTIEGVLRHTGKRGDRDEENFFVPGVLITQTDALSRFSSDMWLGALEGKVSLFGGAWVQSVRGERKSIVNDDLSANPAFAPFEAFERYRANAETWRYTSTIRLDTPGFAGVRHYVTGLAEQKHEGFVQHTYDGIDHERTTRSAAGEIRGEYWNSLFLSGSVRRDSSDRFGDFTTWRTSGSFKIPSTPVRLHASYGTGMKLPTLFEQYGRVPNFFTPNPNLKAETSEGWDSGVEVTLLRGALVVDATWFQSDLKDKIRGTNGFMTVINLPGVSTREGLELSGRVMPLPGLVIGASYTMLEAKEANGFRELRRPGDTARIDVSYTFLGDRAKVGVAAVYNGGMIDEALRTSDPWIFPLSSERVVLADYWLVSATASYKLTDALEIYGRVENLLDRRYQEVYGFETAGLGVYGGVRMRLQESKQAVGSSR